MESNENFYIEYCTKFGDTLNSIAQINGISLDLLLKVNDLTDNNLNIGQVINIPIIFKDDILDVYYFKYKMLSNETVEDVAFKFNVSLNELYDFNNINKDLKFDKQVISIPYHDAVGGVGESQNYIIYTVVGNDTMSSIASEYGLSVSELVSFNKFTNENVFEGMNIKIPISLKASSKYIEYIIRKNDDLADISKNYGYTEKEILLYNGLESNKLEPGTVIKIPVK